MAEEHSSAIWWFVQNDLLSLSPSAREHICQNTSRTIRTRIREQSSYNFFLFVGAEFLVLACSPLRATRHRSILLANEEITKRIRAFRKSFKQITLHFILRYTDKYMRAYIWMFYCCRLLVLLLRVPNINQNDFYLEFSSGVCIHIRWKKATTTSQQSGEGDGGREGVWREKMGKSSAPSFGIMENLLVPRWSVCTPHAIILFNIQATCNDIVRSRRPHLFFEISMHIFFRSSVSPLRSLPLFHVRRRCINGCLSRISSSVWRKSH